MSSPTFLLPKHLSVSMDHLQICLLFVSHLQFYKLREVAGSPHSTQNITWVGAQ